MVTFNIRGCVGISEENNSIWNLNDNWQNFWYLRCWNLKRYYDKNYRWTLLRPIRYIIRAFSTTNKRFDE